MPLRDQRLLNDYQHDFPLCALPFACIGKDLGLDGERVIARLKRLRKRQLISRVGPVFRPNTLGASQLCALATDPASIDRTAAIVNRFTEVNHNYQREHRLNLWFVVTGRDTGQLEACVQQIEAETACGVLRLPLIKAYHIDLGFPVRQCDSPVPTGSARSCVRRCRQSCEANGACTAGGGFATPGDQRFTDELVALVQAGIPLVPRPYRYLAERLGVGEQRVTMELRRMIRDTTIKRFGVVVRHHELGYRANAMVVWNIPDAAIDDIGERLGEEACVSLCYRRPRVLPHWPYNLFCMLHGRQRARVEQAIDSLVRTHGLGDFASCTLFSVRRFKQRGARYRELTGALANG